MNKSKRISIEVSILFIFLLGLGILGSYIVNHRFPPMKADTTDVAPDYIFLVVIWCFILVSIVFVGMVFNMVRKQMLKKCPKCGKLMEKTTKCGDGKKPYAYDVWSCDSCNYDEEIKIGERNE